MRISIFGTGYVGLVTGACLAKVGLEVTCFDIDKERIKDLSKGIVPIFEPGLESLLLEGLEKKKISFTSNSNNSLVDSEAVIVCVGTPDSGTGETNLDAVMGAAKIIGEKVEKSIPVLIKSTVPVGTASKVEKEIRKIIKKKNIDIEVLVASNPEFLHEGVAISEFNYPDRIVLGTEDEGVIKVTKKIYKDFIDKEEKFLVMSRESSELTKYASNSFLATKISFMNQLSQFCSLVGADIEEIRLGMGPDPAIAERYLYAGCGFGGSCLPKDINSLIHQAKEKGKELTILKAVRDVNESQKEYLFSLAFNLFNQDLRNKEFAIWGLSFKPETDDMRGAPSLTIINNLLMQGAKVKAYDPVVTKKPEDFEIQHENLSLFLSANEVIPDSDCLIICTEWEEFRNPDYKNLASSMKRKLILDGRNALIPEEVIKEGFEYFDIGRTRI